MLFCLQGTQKTWITICTVLSGSRMQNDKSARLSANSNSALAGDIATKRSTKSYIIQLNSGLVAWYSFKQRFVAVIITETEYASLVKCIQNAWYLHHILRDFGGFHEPTVVNEDNQPGILCITENGKRKKRVGVRYHIFRKAAMSGEAKMEYWPTAEMIAGMVAKPMQLQKFWHLSWCHRWDHCYWPTRTENGQCVKPSVGMATECHSLAPWLHNVLPLSQGDTMSFLCCMATQYHLILLGNDCHYSEVHTTEVVTTTKWPLMKSNSSNYIQMTKLLCKYLNGVQNRKGEPSSPPSFWPTHSAPLVLCKAIANWRV